MIENISPKDQLSLVALSYNIQKKHNVSEISDLAKIFGISLMTEWRNRQTIPSRLMLNPVMTPYDPEKEKELAFARKIIIELLEKSSAIQKNIERDTYAPWFKQLIIRMLDDGMSYKMVSNLTCVSEDNFPKFRKDTNLMLIKTEITAEHEQIQQIWIEAKPKQRKTLDHFWVFLGRNYPDLGISRQRVREILIDLGLRYPRSKKAKNVGTQVKKEFCPHAIWEGDGKQIVINICGVRYKFCWYAFVDQNTTLIVGSNIGPAESASAFLGALKDGRERQGLLAYGILIDNRLGDRDLGPVSDFCQQHNIQLIRNFPGNSRTNGNIESNFAIFEKFVGDINIASSSGVDLAASVATAIVEIFTQQRNHSPRQRLGNYSPIDRVRADSPPEHIRSAVEKLANRFNSEAFSAEFMWQFIFEARQHFGPLDDKSIAKIMKLLVKYPISDILSAQMKYLAQIRKHPSNTYKSEYFMAILRNTREEEAKQAYNEAFRSGLETVHNLQEKMPLTQRPIDELTRDIMDFLVEVIEEPSPSRRMVELEAFGWWLVQYSADHSLPALWTSISKAAKESMLVSLKSWSEICDYLLRRVGKLLVIEDKPRHDPLS